MGRIVGDEPCPDCRAKGNDLSGNHLMVFDDGGKYCNRCKYRVFPNGTDNKEVRMTSQTIEEVNELFSCNMLARGINQDVAEHYGVKAEYDGAGTEVAYYYPITQQSKLVAYKKRKLPKQFYSLGKKLKGVKVDLFGQSVCPTTNKKLLITGGQDDMLAAYQILHTKYPARKPSVVSVVNGESTYDVGNNLDFLDNFAEIVICMDGDEKGRKAGKELCQLIGGKARLMELPDGSDPNSMLIDNEQKEFIKLFFEAKEYIPDSLLSVEDVYEEAIEMPTWGRKWPWPSLDKLTYGRRDGDGIYIGAGVKAGKCFAAGTEVRMHDGSCKNVEDISVGDLVMGEDSNPRTVDYLHTGRDKMYKVSQNKRDSYTVNSQHILCLQETGTGTRTDISVSEWFQKTKKFRDEYKGYASVIKYKQKNLPIPPYILGVWLGDGHTHNPAITTMDMEILNEWCLYAQTIKSNVTVWADPRGNKALHARIKTGQGRSPNNFLVKLDQAGIDDEKHIPFDYKTTNLKDRLELLAGLIDTDGSRDKNGWEVTFKSKGLSDGMQEVARGCGARATQSIKRVNGVDYYRLHIYGIDIPCRLSRKVRQTPTKRNPLLTGIDIENVGQGTYYGFHVIGDTQRFLLKDGTVVHNTEAKYQIINHITEVEQLPVFLFNPEQTGGTVVKAIAGKSKHKQFHIPDGDFTQQELIEAVDEVKGKVILFNASYSDVGVNNMWDRLKPAIRYAVMAKGVRDVMLDPITQLTDGLTPSETETELRRISNELQGMAQDLGFFYYCFCHLKEPPQGKTHEEGGGVKVAQFRGSRAMAEKTKLMLGIIRDQYADDEADRNTSTFHLLLNSGFGKTGKFEVKYDVATGDYLELQHINSGF